MQSKKLYFVGCVCLSVLCAGLAAGNTRAAAEKRPADSAGVKYVQENLYPLRTAEKVPEVAKTESQIFVQTELARVEVAQAVAVFSHSVSETALPEDVAAKLSLPPLPGYALSLKKILAEPKPEEALKDRAPEDFENSPFLNAARQWQSAADDFQTPDNESVQKAKAEIRRRMTALEKVFNANRVQGNTWKKLLNWDVFAREMRKNELPDIYVLGNTFSQLSCGAYGLELECFAGLRLAIQNYVTLMTVRAKPDEAKEAYGRVCKMLAALMIEAAQNPHGDTQRAVEGCLRWMDWTGQSSEQVAKTRELWGNPNTIVNVTEFLFERYGSRKMNEPQTIREQVGQASISGTATFDGELKIFPVPNDKKAEIRIQLEGTSQGATVAHQGPATVRSNSQSTINATKTITFDHRGLAATRAKANIATESQITSVGVSGRMGQAVAERRAHEQKSQTQRTLSARNAAKIENRMNYSVDPAIKNLNDNLYGDLRKQLEPRGVDLSQTSAQTDDKHLYVYSSLSTMDGLMAATSPPAMTYENDPADIQISVHESAVQNICSGFLAGLLLDEQAVKKFRQSAPKWLRDAQKPVAAAGEESDTERSAIEFSSQMPVTVSFADGKMVIIVVGKQFINNGKSYPALRIAMTYRLAQEDGKFFFVRDGDFELLPPGFDPEADGQLSSSVTTIRRVMTRQLKERMPEKIEIETVPLTKKDGQKKQASEFEMQELELRPILVAVRDGWLQLGFRVEPMK